MTQNNSNNNKNWPYDSAPLRERKKINDNYIYKKLHQERANSSVASLNASQNLLLQLRMLLYFPLSVRGRDVYEKNNVKGRERGEGVVARGGGVVLAA